MYAKLNTTGSMVGGAVPYLALGAAGGALGLSARGVQVLSGIIGASAAGGQAYEYGKANGLRGRELVEYVALQAGIAGLPAAVVAGGAVAPKGSLPGLTLKDMVRSIPGNVRNNAGVSLAATLAANGVNRRFVDPNISVHDNAFESMSSGGILGLFPGIPRRGGNSKPSGEGRGRAYVEVLDPSDYVNNPNPRKQVGPASQSGRRNGLSEEQGFSQRQVPAGNSSGKSAGNEKILVDLDRPIARDPEVPDLVAREPDGRVSIRGTTDDPVADNRVEPTRKFPIVELPRRAISEDGSEVIGERSSGYHGSIHLTEADIPWIFKEGLPQIGTNRNLAEHVDGHAKDSAFRGLTTTLSGGPDSPVRTAASFAQEGGLVFDIVGVEGWNPAYYAPKAVGRLSKAEGEVSIFAGVASEHIRAVGVVEVDAKGNLKVKHWISNPNYKGYSPSGDK
jgi:hypothetical protein